MRGRGRGRLPGRRPEEAGPAAVGAARRFDFFFEATIGYKFIGYMFFSGVAWVHIYLYLIARRIWNSKFTPESGLGPSRGRGPGREPDPNWPTMAQTSRHFEQGSKCRLPGGP